MIRAKHQQDYITNFSCGSDYHPLDQVLMPVAFVTNHKVPNISSQAVAVIGSTPELGRWRAMNARAMFEVEPDKWATILYLPKGLRFRYKFIIIEKSRTKVGVLSGSWPLPFPLLNATGLYVRSYIPCKFDSDRLALCNSSDSKRSP